MSVVSQLKRERDTERMQPLLKKPPEMEGMGGEIPWLLLVSVSNPHPQSPGVPSIHWLSLAGSRLTWEPGKQPASLGIPELENIAGKREE